jgi:hypothetical protein
MFMIFVGVTRDGKGKKGVAGCGSRSAGFGVLVLSFSRLFLRHDAVVCLKWAVDPRRVTHDVVIRVFIIVFIKRLARQTEKGRSSSSLRYLFDITILRSKTEAKIRFA